MAFVTLEDLQGQCDVVVFPRTWEETKELWVQDRIVLVRGKAEKRGEGINVLCDTVQTYVTRALAADESDAYVVLWAANRCSWTAMVTAGSWLGLRQSPRPRWLACAWPTRPRS